MTNVEHTSVELLTVLCKHEAQNIHFCHCALGVQHLEQAGPGAGVAVMQ